MNKTIFKITKMDCPSEENLIRMKLNDLPQIVHLDFDLSNRQLTVFHKENIAPIESAIVTLNLGASKQSTAHTEKTTFQEAKDQRQLLWTVLAINFAFFVIEMTTGLLSKSMGLIADSLDMLADAFVYGVSLLAVGGTMIRKKQVAKVAGYAQIVLAVIGFVEVLRRFFQAEQLPNVSDMIVVSIFALLANAVCLYLLQRSKTKDEVHMRASMIFTSNDVIINIGVIIAGVLVNWLQSNKPDLIIGTIIFILVIQGAVRILKLSK